MNHDYFRSEPWAGLQRSSAVAGILQQFPNDCYMVRSAAARAIKWGSHEEIGNACDYVFGLRLGLTRTQGLVASARHRNAQPCPSLQQKPAAA
jgi:hypothetical protein